MPEETNELLRQLRDDTKALRSGVGRLRKIAVALIVAVLVSALCIWRVVAWAVCTTDRNNALKGPANDRVSYLIGGSFRAALSPPHLAVAERVKETAFLDKTRARLSGIPSHAALAKLPDSQIVVFVQAINSVDAQADYDMQSKRHPVCSVSGF